MTDNICVQKSFDFAVRIVNVYKYLNAEYKEYVLSKQLLRSGTSIGANIHEADYAESPTDFIHKLKIALKECHETEYWLHVLAATCPELAEQAKELRRESGSIRRMLISSIRTCQNNIEAKAYKV